MRCTYTAWILASLATLAPMACDNPVAGTAALATAAEMTRWNLAAQRLQQHWGVEYVSPTNITFLKTDGNITCAGVPATGCFSPRRKLIRYTTEHVLEHESMHAILWILKWEHGACDWSNVGHVKHCEVP